MTTSSPLAIDRKAIKLGSHCEETYELLDQTSRNALATSAKQEEHHGEAHELSDYVIELQLTYKYQCGK